VTDAEIIIAIAAAPVSVWIGLLVTSIVWASRRVLRRCRREWAVVMRAFRTRTLRAVVDGTGALVTLCWLLTFALSLSSVLLTIGPVLLAILGLDMTAHLIKVSH
jgi:hypothetical protein